MSKRGNNEGSIVKRNDGRWCAVYTIGRNEDGSLRRKYIYGKTRQEVAEKLNLVQTEIITGNYIEPNKTSTAEWFDFWLKEYKKHQLKPNTYSSYEQNIRLHIKPKIGHILLKDLTSEHLQKLINNEYNSGRCDHSPGALSVDTIRKISSILCGALKQAVKNRLIHYNYAESISLPKGDKKVVRALSIQEQDIFISLIENDESCFAFMLKLFTGMRRGELLGLKWCDVDFENSQLFIHRSLGRVKLFDREKKSELLFQKPKTKSSSRIIYIPHVILEMLKTHKYKQELKIKAKKNSGEQYIDDDLVFSTESGKPVNPRNLLRKFYSLIKKAGLTNANLHTLRHTFISRLIEVGTNIKVATDMAGHASAKILLDTYAEAFPEHKREAAEKVGLLIDKRSK